MGYVVCRRCRSRIQLAVRLRSLAPTFFTATCQACGSRGVYSYADIVEEGVYRAGCDVCGVRLYSFRLGPARCPVCGSRYLVAPGGWQLLERGELKPDPAQELATVGMLAGGIAGARRGRSPAERIAGMVSGSASGLLLGWLLGSLIKTMFRTEREVVYEPTQERQPG
jgi:DNA-directed RNA polymerase subunit RPC12/RpoP